MSNRVIDKSAIPDFLNELLATYPVSAPIKRDGLINIEPLDDEAQQENCIRVLADFWNTRQAPKELFFPRSETLFTYRENKVVPTSQVEERRVVLGIRPCDARSAILLDQVFDAPDYQDPYYVNRRKNTILIGLACNKPASTCFCTALGGGPFSVEGLDLLLTDLGDRYLADVITERGEALLNDSAHFRPATDQDRDLQIEIATRSEQAISGPNVEGIKEKLDGMYDDPFWDELHLKCLGCGLCTYLCPTCHCFDIVDEGNRVQGRRVRNWDTCQLSLFTHHASGHNPRPSGRERMRQRVMHKFNYFVANFGEMACVGCGRCVRDCPVNLDIRATIEGINQVEEK